MHRGTPTRHRGQRKGTRKGSTGPHRGRPSRHRGLGKSFSGEALGSTGANPAGTGAWEASLGEVVGCTGACLLGVGAGSLVKETEEAAG